MAPSLGPRNQAAPSSRPLHKTMLGRASDTVHHRKLNRRFLPEAYLDADHVHFSQWRGGQLESYYARHRSGAEAQNTFFNCSTPMRPPTAPLARRSALDVRAKIPSSPIPGFEGARDAGLSAFEKHRIKGEWERLQVLPVKPIDVSADPNEVSPQPQRVGGAEVWQVDYDDDGDGDGDGGDGGDGDGDQNDDVNDAGGFLGTPGRGIRSPGGTARGRTPLAWTPSGLSRTQTAAAASSPLRSTLGHVDPRMDARPMTAGQDVRSGRWHMYPQLLNRSIVTSRGRKYIRGQKKHRGARRAQARLASSAALTERASGIEADVSARLAQLFDHLDDPCVV